MLDICTLVAIICSVFKYMLDTTGTNDWYLTGYMYYTESSTATIIEAELFGKAYLLNRNTVQFMILGDSLI